MPRWIDAREDEAEEEVDEASSEEEEDEEQTDQAEEPVEQDDVDGEQNGEHVKEEPNQGQLLDQAGRSKRSAIPLGNRKLAFAMFTSFC